jgi:hypothetical protein
MNFQIQITQLGQFLQRKAPASLLVMLALLLATLWDRYIDLCQWAARMWLALRVYIVNMQRARAGRVSRVVAAFASDNDIDTRISVVTDVTEIILDFYDKDAFLTTASLDRWMQKFGSVPPYVTIVFVRDDLLHASTINIQDDSEYVLGYGLPDDGLMLDTLPARLIKLNA